MTETKMITLHCDMRQDCDEPVTHIGQKGYVYCAKHAPNRVGVERTRKMRAWEIQDMVDGNPINYKRLPHPATVKA